MTVAYGKVVDFFIDVRLDGYTPLCLTDVHSNHAGSCSITQFGFREGGSAYASVQNNEVTNRGTWRDLKISFTVLYRKSIA